MDVGYLDRLISDDGGCCWRHEQTRKKTVKSLLPTPNWVVGTLETNRMFRFQTGVASKVAAYYKNKLNCSRHTVDALQRMLRFPPIFMVHFGFPGIAIKTNCTSF